MPLRINDGLPITVAPSPTSELESGFMDDFTILPDDELVIPDSLGRPLDVSLFRQRKDQWCWVACAQMVLRFFGSFLTQCEIAHRQLEKPCCSDSIPPAFCDEGCTVKEIDQAFEHVGLAGLRIDKAAELNTLDDELNRKKRPVVAGISWGANRGGHLVVLTALRTFKGINYVRVNDPFYGPGEIRYTDLVESYGRNNNGQWIHTWKEFTRS